MVAIIGIFASALLFSTALSGSNRELEQEARRLEGLLGLLREEALMQNRDYGVEFTESGYRFYVYDYQQLEWLPPLDDQLFKEHMLKEPYKIDIRLDDRDVSLEAGFDRKLGEDAGPEPQLLVLATGEITPFFATFHRDLEDAHVAVRGTLTGGLEITKDENEAL